MQNTNLGKDLADYYIRALENQGIKVPDDASGYERLIQDGSVRIEIRRQILMLDSSNNNSAGYIVQKLLQDAIIQYSDRLQRSQEIQEIAILADYYRSYYQTKISLWKRMIEAAHTERIFTDVELECFTKLAQRYKKSLKSARSNAGPQIDTAACALVDREMLDQYGLLLDPQMMFDIEYLIGNALKYRPTLLVGDKGIAKTQVARFVMGLYDHEPIVVSIKGDTSTHDLIGKPQSFSGNEIIYPEGPIIAAMREGVPILLDEINFGNQAVIARLHDILLRKPHDKVYFPELGYDVEIQPGFMVFATANEASSRYRQRQYLDPALRDRFEILVRTYPDLDTNVTADTFNTLRRMAYAYATDSEGILSRHIDPELLDKFVKVSAVTERLYVMDAKDVAKSVPANVLTPGQNKPLIEDCISPRTLCRVVEDSSLGNLPGRNLDLFLIDNIITTLDQDGTAHNANIVRAVCETSGIDLYDRTKRAEEDYAGDEDGEELTSM